MSDENIEISFSKYDLVLMVGAVRFWGIESMGHYDLESPSRHANKFISTLCNKIKSNHPKVWEEISSDEFNRQRFEEPITPRPVTPRPDSPSKYRRPFRTPQI